MSYLTEEIASQPGCWSRAIEMAGSAGTALPGPGERVAVALARARGLDPDRPRNLARSVILTTG